MPLLQQQKWKNVFHSPYQGSRVLWNVPTDIVSEMIIKRKKYARKKSLGMTCPDCLSIHIRKDGIRKNTMRGMEQKYECKDCGLYFINYKYPHMKFHYSILQQVLWLHLKKQSSRKIKTILYQQGIKISHKTIRNWIKRFMTEIPKLDVVK